MARHACLDGEPHGHPEEQFGEFFGDQQVADYLVGAALAREERPVERLRRRYEGLGFGPGALPSGFDGTRRF